MPQTGAITVQHTAPNGGTTHLVVGAPPYQSNQDGDLSSLVMNQSHGSNMVVQQQPTFAQQNLQATNQFPNQLQQPHGQTNVQYSQMPQPSLQIVKSNQVPQIVNQQLPQKMQPKIIQATETTAKKKKTKKKNVKVTEPIKTTTTNVMTIAQPPTPPVAPQESSFIEGSQTQVQTSQVFSMTMVNPLSFISLIFFFLFSLSHHRSSCVSFSLL